jgi:hypothetical protein
MKYLLFGGSNMRNPISKADWEKVKEALMLAQIPFRVTFDSHWDGKSENLDYDIQIQIEPFYFQETRKI